MPRLPSTKDGSFFAANAAYNPQPEFPVSSQRKHKFPGASMSVCKSLFLRVVHTTSAALSNKRRTIRLFLIWTIALGLLMLAPLRLRSQAADDEPRSPAAKPATGRFALAFKASTLGLGADAGIRLARHFNLRVGFGTFNYRRNLSEDGIAYDSAFRLRSVQTVLDWFPFAESFHLSGGLLVYNGNHVSANATLPTNQVLTAFDTNIISNPSNPISGKATSGVRPVAPIFSIGFGNLVARARHVGFSVDFGVVLQGSPHSSLTFTGSACDVSGTFCADIAGDPAIQSQAVSVSHTISKDLFFLKYYPFVSMEVGYRF
jgi:hypothetical protein